MDLTRGPPSLYPALVQRYFEISSLSTFHFLLSAYGQINRHPGYWSPEWLRAYFIFYYPISHPSRSAANPSLQPGVSYSVLFRHNSSTVADDDEESEDLGNSHIIDYSLSCWTVRDEPQDVLI
jgi:hypothetical protein